MSAAEAPRSWRRHGLLRHVAYAQDWVRVARRLWTLPFFNDFIFSCMIKAERFRASAKPAVPLFLL